MAYSIAEALGNFSQFLGQETQRMEAEDQKELVRASTQRISEAFSKVSPLATEEDVRQLMLDTISDAAGLGTLDTSMPLIQGLYSDSVNAIRNYKARRQDELLSDFVRQRQPDISSEAEGQTAYNMFQISKTGEKELTIREEDATYWTKYDEFGKEKPGFRIQTGPGWEQEARTTAQISATTQRQYAPKSLQYTGAMTKEGYQVVFDPDRDEGGFFKYTEKGYIPISGKDFTSNLTLKLDAQKLKENNASLKEAIDTQKATYKLVSTNAGTLLENKNILNAIGDTDEPINWKTFAQTGEPDYFATIRGLSANQLQAMTNAINSEELRVIYKQYLASADTYNETASDINAYQYRKDINAMFEDTGLDEQGYQDRYNAIKNALLNQASDPTTASSTGKVIAKWRNVEKAGDKKHKELNENSPLTELMQAWEDMNMIYKGYVLKEVKFE